ncbi:MAG: CTP synthase, partial [Dehalococcoidales bacterium]|nr:CTP synthase [Dehalococcoidales bacterium]
TQELKTKPTQHSVNELRRIGIQPDVIACRSDYPIPENLRDKISLFCDVSKEAVIPMPTVSTIYEIPLMLEEYGVGQLIMDKLCMNAKPADLTQWAKMVERMKTPHEPVRIALVGKYVELNDAYYSVREALYHAALYNDRALDLFWVHSEELDKSEADALLRTAQGIIVPGGFGIRGIEGMVKAAKYARENKIPYFGLCLGLQVMVIELARHVFKTDEPNSTEFHPDTKYPVIDYLLEQKKLVTKGGNMRLGNYPCKLVKGTLAYKAYGQEEVLERHRHRLEFNNEYREPLQKAGMQFSGLSPDGSLVEICELKDHPWMVGVQFHPEFLSRPNRPQPLFREFVGVAKDVLREGAQPPLPLAAK